MMPDVVDERRRGDASTEPYGNQQQASTALSEEPTTTTTATSIADSPTFSEQQKQRARKFAACFFSPFYLFATGGVCGPAIAIPILFAFINKYAKGDTANPDPTIHESDPRVAKTVAIPLLVVGFATLFGILGMSGSSALPMKKASRQTLFRLVVLAVWVLQSLSLVMLFFAANEAFEFGVGKAINNAPLYRAECGRLHNVGNETHRYAVEFDKRFLRLWRLRREQENVTVEVWRRFCEGGHSCENKLIDVSITYTVMDLDTSSADASQLAILRQWCGAEYVVNNDSKRTSQAAIMADSYTAAKARFGAILNSSKMKYPLLRKTRHFSTAVDDVDPAKVQKLVNETTILFMDTDEATPLDINDRERKYEAFVVAMWIFYPATLFFLVLWVHVTIHALRTLCCQSNSESAETEHHLENANDDEERNKTRPSSPNGAVVAMTIRREL